MIQNHGELNFPLYFFSDKFAGDRYNGSSIVLIIAMVPLPFSTITAMDQVLDFLEMLLSIDTIFALVEDLRKIAEKKFRGSLKFPYKMFPK